MIKKRTKENTSAYFINSKINMFAEVKSSVKFIYNCVEDKNIFYIFYYQPIF